MLLYCVVPNKTGNKVKLLTDLLYLLVIVTSNTTNIPRGRYLWGGNRNVPKEFVDLFKSNTCI